MHEGLMLVMARTDWRPSARRTSIVVLKAGRIVDIGRHDELVTRGGLHAKLATMWFGLEAQLG